MQDSAQFPYESRFTEVLGSQMHYVEAGQGDPILFIHGQPASSYLWRNVIPRVEGRGRAIAVDLIGMGRSGKPDIDYRFADHYRHLEGFIDALALDRITLVGHDWGTVLAFNYAMRHPGRVTGIAFLEALIPPAFPLPSLDALPQPARSMFAGFRDPEQGRRLLIEQNVFIEKMLPAMTMRQLSEEEMAAYREPFLDPSSRLPLYRWPNELPIAGKPQEVDALIREIGQWLQTTALPKLHIYASPGAANPLEVVAWTTENLPNIETAYVGAGLHFIQEDQPEAIGRAISEWLRRRQMEGKACGTEEMKAFYVFHLTVKRPEAFQKYAQAVGRTLKAFGGQVALRGQVDEVLAGRHDHHMVGVLRFPNQEAARGWYMSPPYQSLIPLRDEAAEVTVIRFQAPPAADSRGGGE